VLQERAVELGKELSKPRGLSHAFAIARYFASALERETIGWRLDDQDHRLALRRPGHQVKHG